MRQPNNLHPDVFDIAWQRWSIVCARHEIANGAPLTKAMTDKLWEASVKITDYHIRLDWNSFCRTHGLGVYK